MTEQAKETEKRGNLIHNEFWGLLALWAMEARSHGGSPKNSSAMCLCEAWGLGNTYLLAFVNLVVLWVSLGAVEGVWGKAGGGCRKV